MDSLSKIQGKTKQQVRYDHRTNHLLVFGGGARWLVVRMREDQVWENYMANSSNICFRRKLICMQLKPNMNIILLIHYLFSWRLQDTYVYFMNISDHLLLRLTAHLTCFFVVVLFFLQTIAIIFTPKNDIYGQCPQKPGTSLREYIK